VKKAREESRIFFSVIRSERDPDLFSASECIEDFQIPAHKRERGMKGRGEFENQRVEDFSSTE
jgi:hypothetical protein